RNDFLALCIEKPAGFSQPQITSRTVDELGVQIFFKLRQNSTHARFILPERSRRFGQALAFRDRYEDRKMIKIELIWIDAHSATIICIFCSFCNPRDRPRMESGGDKMKIAIFLSLILVLCTGCGGSGSSSGSMSYQGSTPATAHLTDVAGRTVY